MMASKKKKRLNWQHVGLALLTVATLAVVGFALRPEAPPTSAVTFTPKPATTATPTTKPTPQPLKVERPADGPLRVLFAGDSLTSGRDASSPETAFRALVTAQLGIGGEVAPVKIGKSGLATAGVLPEVAGIAPSDLLIVELGTNDFYKSTLAKFKLDYPAFLDAVRAKSPDAPLVCAGMWQTAASGLPFDTVIQDECVKRGGRFVPLSMLYVNKANQSVKGLPHWEGGFTDGNHPNDAGHRLIADALLAALVVS